MKKILLLFIWTFPLSIIAQENPEVFSSFNAWHNLNIGLKLPQNTTLFVEGHWRVAETYSTNLQFLCRPGFRWSPSKKITLDAGYTYIKTYPYGDLPVPIPVIQHNIWERLNFKQKIGKISLSHRFWVEHRWNSIIVTQEEDLILDGYNFDHRGRYRITGSTPVPKVKENALSFYLFYEPMMIFYKNTRPKKFDQHWIGTGLNYKINPNLKVNLGYMHQTIRKGDGSQYESNPTLTFGVFLSISPFSAP